MKIVALSISGDSRWASLGAVVDRVIKCAACLREVTMDSIGVIFSDSSYRQQDAHLCDICAFRITKAGKA